MLATLTQIHSRENRNNNIYLSYIEKPLPYLFIFKLFPKRGNSLMNFWFPIIQQPNDWHRRKFRNRYTSDGLFHNLNCQRSACFNPLLDLHLDWVWRGLPTALILHLLSPLPLISYGGRLTPPNQKMAFVSLCPGFFPCPTPFNSLIYF